MPYKDPEKRKEADRRHKEKVKREREEKKTQIEKALELQTNLKYLLTERCGFESMPFSEFIEMAQACTISGNDVFLNGQRVDPFDVLTGFNLLLAVTTVKLGDD